MKGKVPMLLTGEHHRLEVFPAKVSERTPGVD